MAKFLGIDDATASTSSSSSAPRPSTSREPEITNATPSTSNEADNNDNSLASDSRNEIALSAEIQSIIERIQNNSTGASDATQRYQSRNGVNTRFDNDSDDRDDEDDGPGKLKKGLEK